LPNLQRDLETKLPEGETLLDWAAKRETMHLRETAAAHCKVNGSEGKGALL